MMLTYIGGGPFRNMIATSSPYRKVVNDGGSVGFLAARAFFSWNIKRFKILPVLITQFEECLSNLRRGLTRFSRYPFGKVFHVNPVCGSWWRLHLTCEI